MFPRNFRNVRCQTPAFQMDHCIVLSGLDEIHSATVRADRSSISPINRLAVNCAHDATLLLVDGTADTAASLRGVAGSVVRLADVVTASTSPSDGNASRSYLISQWLRQQRFSAVDFPYAGGLGYHSICAKRQGIGLSDTLLRVRVDVELADSPLCDVDGGGIEWLATTFMEKESLWACDVRVGQSTNGGDPVPEQVERREASPSLAAPHALPLVSVCLVHHERPALLSHAVTSLAKQDYPNCEVILVDDGSRQADALEYLRQLEPFFAARGWRIHRQDNLYLGAARNQAARLARGEYLMFMDDDNVARADELSIMVAVAQRTSAAIVSCTPAVFHGDGPPPDRASHVWVPYGPSLAIGLVVNGFGDANALVERSCFESLGGFTEDYGVGHEDWEFFARAALAGYKIELVPEPLFYYRVRESGMLRSGERGRDLARSIRPYMEKYGEIGPALTLLQALFEDARRS